VGQLTVGERGRVHLRGGVADQLLVRREPPEAADQRRRGVVFTRQLHRLRDQSLRVGQRLVELVVTRAQPARQGQPGAGPEVQLGIGFDRCLIGDGHDLRAPLTHDVVGSMCRPSA
jgi:hypothetical protein